MSSPSLQALPVGGRPGRSLRDVKWGPSYSTKSKSEPIARGPSSSGSIVPHPAPHTVEIVQALSIRVNNLVYEMQARGRDVIVLSLREAFFDIPFFGFEHMPFPASYHYSYEVRG